jgi:uncharacterized protein (TIGR00369 family)
MQLNESAHGSSGGIVPTMTTRWEAFEQGRVKMPVNETLGFRPVPVDDPTNEIAFTWEVPSELCNSAGQLQGGMLAAFADAVLGASSAAHLPEDRYPSLAEMKLSILRPSPAGASLTARGRVIKAGKRILFTEVEITNEDGELVAKASGTAVPSTG